MKNTLNNLDDIGFIFQGEEKVIIHASNSFILAMVNSLENDVKTKELPNTLITQIKRNNVVIEFRSIEDFNDKNFEPAQL